MGFCLLARVFGADLIVVIPLQLIVAFVAGLMLETRMRNRVFASPSA